MWTLGNKQQTTDYLDQLRDNSCTTNFSASISVAVIKVHNKNSPIQGRRIYFNSKFQVTISQLWKGKTRTQTASLTIFLAKTNGIKIHLLPSLLVLIQLSTFIFSSGTHVKGMVLPIQGQIFLQQFSVNRITYRYEHRAPKQRKFSLTTIFQCEPVLCQVESEK